SDVILAGNVWAKVAAGRAIPKYESYDSWAVPDLAGLAWYWKPPRGLVQLSSVALPFIHPVAAWRQHPFHNPEDHMKDGIWYNQFCREAGLPVLADLDIRFYRTKYDADVGFRGFRKELRVLGGRWKQRLLKRAPAGSID